MDKDCPICNSCKGTRAHCRTKKVHGEPDKLPMPKKFADAITCDHKILNEDDASRDRDRVALVVLDRHTKWLQSYAAETKEASEVILAMKRFVGPQVVPEHIYTDNSKEFAAAFEELNWSHDTSTPYRSQTNGVIERSVRVVKEGTACALVQSGLENKWWPEAMDCFCFLRNTSVPLEDGDTAYKKRFAKDFEGRLIPFGAEVTYLPIAPKDKKRTHAMSNKQLPGIFLGYKQQAGGGWSGDLMVVDWEQMYGASSINEVHIKELRSKEVTPIITNGVWRFPCATGALRQPGFSPLELPNPEPFGAGGNSMPIEDDTEEHLELQRTEVKPAEGDYDAEDRLKLTADGMPSSADEVAKVLEEDFWTTNGNVLVCHHRVPRTNLFTPTDPECPLPTKYLDVTRRTYTSIETEAESCVEDFWNMNGNRALSEEWVGKTIFEVLNFPPKKNYHWVSGRETKIQQTSRPGNVWPEVWDSLSDKKKEKAIADWKILEPKLNEARSSRGGELHIPRSDTEFPKLINELIETLKQPKAPAMPVVATSPDDMAYAARSYLGIHGRAKGRPNSKAEAGGNSSPTTKEQKTLKEHKRDICNHYWHLFATTKSSVSAGGNSSRGHVEKVAPRGYTSEEWFACVHTPISVPKAMQIPDGLKAMKKEWDKLEVKDNPAWDVTQVRPRADVIRDAKIKKKPVHFGSLMELCHIKNSQMDKQYWSYKGRIVFRGDIVKNEDGAFAVFTEQGASASNMAAAKFLDAIARLPGNDGEDSDAIGAYTQVKLSEAAKLLGPNVVTETWISLPYHKRPASWKNIEDPVCPLLLNLYGHPLAGLLWELFQEDILFKAGFEKVKSWECLYFHRAKQLFLSAYVDDYKMAGRKENITPMWDLLRSKGLELEPAVSLKSNVYLGCSQREVQPDQKIIDAKSEMLQRICFDKTSSGKPLGTNQPELKERSEVTAPAKSKTKKKKGKAKTIEQQTIDGLQKAAKENSWRQLPANKGKVAAWTYEMFGHCTQTVERYLELSGKDVKSLSAKAATPCIDDHLIPPEEFEVKGALSPVAARVVLKALYVARIARYDFMWAVNMLAREVTRWTQACDRRLHRLVSYMHQTSDYAQLCYVGDRPSDCWLTLFSDASFAGDLRDSKSTSGGLLALVGPNTFVPVSWLCKKQGAVSHSTAESEVISLDTGVRLEGIPALMLWSLIIDVFEPTAKNKGPSELTFPEKLNIRKTYDLFGAIDYVPPSLPICYGRGKLFCLEDNDAVIKMIVKGRSPNLRHVGRTHRVDLDWLFERIMQDPGIYVKYVGTKEQLADILTKGSFTAEAWNTLMNLCLILPPQSRKYINDLKPLK